jgi:hypothetical protein
MSDKQIIKVHDKDGVYRSMAVEKATTARDVVATFVKKLHAQGAQSSIGADQYRLSIDFPDGSMFPQIHFSFSYCICNELLLLTFSIIFYALSAPIYFTNQ